MSDCTGDVNFTAGSEGKVNDFQVKIEISLFEFKKSPGLFMRVTWQHFGHKGSDVLHLVMKENEPLFCFLAFELLIFKST